MKELWQGYSEKFIAISSREQYLILITGFVAVTFIFFSLFIDEKLIRIEKLNKDIRQTTSSNKSAQTTIDILQQSLTKDPNSSVRKQLAQYEKKLASVDNELMLLTSDLINPIQMRYALIDLLKNQQNVSLLSFEVIPAQAVVAANDNTGSDNDDSEQSLTLYKHGIKLKLKGSYFQLRDYLSQLEKLQWKFFWQEFDYQLIEYPSSELIIDMYSLSTKKEFIGV